ncbi:MAG TPA: PKD domain-containing protein [Bacteroidales bacterium]|nr:PKD domain-containing protein [Bacteroidales bacterium]
MKTKILIICISISGMIITSCKKDDPAPTANFTAKSTAYLSEPVDFVSQSLNAESLEWDFGDNTTSTEKNVTHIYTSSGNYIVKLTAKNGTGSDIYSQPVLVKGGKSEYNAVNKSSVNIELLSFYGGNGIVQELVEHGYIISGDSSGFVFTNRRYIYLGGTLSGNSFICVFPFAIEFFRKNHLPIYDTTLIYCGAKLRTPAKSEIMQLKDLKYKK